MKFLNGNGLGHTFLAAAFICTISAILSDNPVGHAQEGPADPPEITTGERLFLETRFAQFFKQFLSGGASVNDSLPAAIR
jgi:hypothetical protein